MVASSSDDFNQRLQRLAQDAQKHPPLSYQRQLALNKLIHEILQSGQLSHPQRGEWQSSVYEDLYHEALQKTWLYICERIENYRSEHPVMAWVNYLLNIQFIAVVKRFDNKQHISLPSLDELDKIPLEDETLIDANMLRQFIEEDPENLLKSKHIRGRPDLTLQRLAWARVVEDRSWDDLSQTFTIPSTTLCTFFKRQMRKLMPYFHRHL
jgi:tRNA(Met) C34 N-acetyltransferase TmcA